MTEDRKIICTFRNNIAEQHGITTTGDPNEPFKWVKGIVTYKLTNETGDIPNGHIQHSALNLAFTNWHLAGDIADIKFERVYGTTPADITVSFSKTDPFFTDPGILAYTYFPNPSLPNHQVISVFNDDPRIIWSLTGNPVRCGDLLAKGMVKGCDNPDNLIQTINLTETMTHEMGHGLGLQHINTDFKNVMYFTYHPDDTLQPEDISAIQKLYGVSNIPQHIRDSINYILLRFRTLGR